LLPAAPQFEPAPPQGIKQLLAAPPQFERAPPQFFKITILSFFKVISGNFLKLFFQNL